MLRRSFVSLPFLLVAGLSTSKAYSQEDAEMEIIGELPQLPDDLAEFASEPPAPYTDLAAVGTAKPKRQEAEEAYEILLNSPFGTNHVDVARYFLSLSGTQEKYRREWPIRANPLIYHFFSATQTRPEGDTTPWCAAALNWFLLRGRASKKEEIGQAPGLHSVGGLPFPQGNVNSFSTESAASGSFRCLKETKSPVVGHIAVLANKGTEDLTKYCRGQGHVAIFLKQIDQEKVQVIGGNQSEKGSNGAITLANINIGPGTRFLKFVSPPGV
jgi:hypothetical protein